mmetsp:Transcript_28326/g.88275  ORF Transcript_28326/g.88275 Transcript_28326/m.88275 type:complete len:281 (+) Transcript_28326:512-1354(+)
MLSLQAVATLDLFDVARCCCCTLQLDAVVTMLQVAAVACRCCKLLRRRMPSLHAVVCCCSVLLLQTAVARCCCMLLLEAVEACSRCMLLLPVAAVACCCCMLLLCCCCMLSLHAVVAVVGTVCDALEAVGRGRSVGMVCTPAFLTSRAEHRWSFLKVASVCMEELEVATSSLCENLLRMLTCVVWVRTSNFSGEACDPREQVPFPQPVEVQVALSKVSTVAVVFFESTLEPVCEASMRLNEDSITATRSDISESVAWDRSMRCIASCSMDMTLSVSFETF